jgi:hypothetical protein
MKKTITVLLSILAVPVLFASEPFYERLLVGAPSSGATMEIDGSLRSVDLEPTELHVTVALAGNTRGDGRNIYPGDWARWVKILVGPDGGELRDARAVLLKQNLERVAQHPRTGDYEHSVEAEFRLDGVFTKGQYRVRVSYGNHAEEIIVTVVHGDETVQLREWVLQRQLEKATTWDEIKRINFARIENNPKIIAPWAFLAGAAEEYAGFEETKGYWEHVLAIARAGGSRFEETAEGIEQRIQLLPRYYADREHLRIVMTPSPVGDRSVIELRERKASDWRPSKKKE